MRDGGGGRPGDGGFGTGFDPAVRAGEFGGAAGASEDIERPAPASSLPGISQDFLRTSYKMTIPRPSNGF
jgi:hypothetical protein